MNLIFILLNILGIILVLIIIIVIFVLLVPFRYNLKGGYENRPWINFNLRCSPAFILNGTWDKHESTELQARLILFGIPLKFNPKKSGKKNKLDKEKKESKKKNFLSLLPVIDTDFKLRGIALIKDLSKILEPDLLTIKGKIGFEEPHQTGWLAAITNTLSNCCKNTFIDIEPVWGEEYYEFETMIRGKIRLGLILIKIGWFLFINRIRPLFSKVENNKATSTA